jgi:hypothetical protein
LKADQIPKSGPTKGVVDTSDLERRLTGISGTTPGRRPTDPISHGQEESMGENGIGARITVDRRSDEGPCRTLRGGGALENGNIKTVGHSAWRWEKLEDLADG